MSKMTLGQKQRLFARKLPLLIAYAYERGYEITLGDAFASTGHRKESLHYLKLAIDLNLFKDGRYLRSTKSHQFLGEFWESMGGTWGGRFGDGNHYSMEHNGRK